MSALHRVLLRDFWRLKGQMLTIALVVASGVATFVTMLSTYFSLEGSQRTYYEQAHFADVFVSARRAPAGLERRLLGLRGVGAVETRIVTDVTLDIPGLEEPATGRLVSIPERRQETMNRVYLRAGRRPAVGNSEEVIISEALATANELSTGDQIYALLNGRRQRLTIVGIGLSPEFLFVTKPGELLNDDKRFGIIWMRRNALAAAFDMEGAFNDAVIDLGRGASEQEVIASVDQLLEPYGGLGAYGRADQMSHFILNQEIQQLEAQAIVAPIIFLGVAAFLLNVVLARLIGTQREQIAALKALGYSNARVALHYVELVAMVIAIGALIGAAVGAWFGLSLTELYAGFFRFPVLRYHMDLWIPLVAAGISMVASTTGSLGAVHQAVTLSPAEAMRPQAPARFRPTLLERAGLGRLLSARAMMILRSVERRPVRALLSSLGVGFAIAILILGSFSQDSVSYIMDVQFRLAQREDIQVTFNENLSPRAAREIARLPGVRQVEGIRTVPAELHSAQRSARVAVQGVPKDSQLRLILDEDLRVIQLPERGLLLSEQLAKNLKVRPGQTVRLQELVGERRARNVLVRATVPDMMGLNAYMSTDALGSLVDEPTHINGALVSFSPEREQQVYRRLKRLPQVAGVTLKTAALRQFQETSAKFILIFTVILSGFAAVLATGIVYNAARVSLSERSRELASLRVLGFTRGEISQLLLGELGLLLLLGIPIGFLLGRGMAVLVMTTVDPDYMRLPVLIEARTYAFATLVVLVAGLFSALLVRRKLDRLDLVAVLKTRE